MATRRPPTLSEALRTYCSPWGPSDNKTNVFNKLVTAFYHPTFRFQLPRISGSGWDTCIDDIAEAEKLEFLGDGAIGDSVGDIVTQLRPDGNPHIYTQIKQTLTCNAFFAQLMFRYGVVNKGENTKEAADAFEVIVGSFKRERGAQGVEDWAWEYFGPIVFAAWEVWDELQRRCTFQGCFTSHIQIQMNIESRRRYLLAQSPSKPPGTGTRDDPFVIE